MPDPQHPPVPRTRLGRWSVRIGLVLAALLAIQLITYFWLAEEAMPCAGLTHLANYKFIHHCEFAAIGAESWEQLTSGQRAALEREFNRHVKIIYHSAEAIPDSSKHFVPVTEHYRLAYPIAVKLQSSTPEALEQMRKTIEAGRVLDGFRNGMLFGWQLERRGPFWMKCSSGCWISSKGAEGGSDYFLWFFGRWVRVWGGPHLLA